MTDHLDIGHSVLNIGYSALQAQILLHLIPRHLDHFQYLISVDRQGFSGKDSQVPSCRVQLFSYLFDSERPRAPAAVEWRDAAVSELYGQIRCEQRWFLREIQEN